MSTELNELTTTQDMKDCGVTSFFGGKEMGTCLQLTQGLQAVQLDVEQAEQLVKTLKTWIVNNRPQPEPTGMGHVKQPLRGFSHQ